MICYAIKIKYLTKEVSWLKYAAYFKVIVLDVDTFCSAIIDERHFSNNTDAVEYANAMKKAGYYPIIAKM